MDKKLVWVLFIVVATELIGFGLIIPMLPQLVEQFKVSSFLAGLLLAAYSLAQFFAAPFLGALSDRWGRRPILLLSKFGTCIAYIIMALSHTYWLFFISRLIDGFTGGNISVARAYIVDITTPENRSKGMAVIGMAFGLGFVVGPALGGFLYKLEGGHFYPALVAGSLSLLAWFFSFLFLKEPNQRIVVDRRLFKPQLVFNLKDKRILMICFVYFVYMILFAGFESTFSVFTERVLSLSLSQNSWLFLYIGILAIVVQSGLVRKKIYRLERNVLIGLCFVSFSYLLMGVTTKLLILLLLLPAFSLGIGLVNTCLPALLSHITDNTSQGLVMGFYESLGSLARVIGPIGIYWILFDGRDNIYLSFGGLSLLITCFFFFVFLRKSFLHVYNRFFM